MRSCTERWAFILSAGAILAAAEPAQAASAGTNAAPGINRRAVEEKELCTGNLKVIYDAIQAYQADHKDLPNWLSDLVPQYLADANVLICPVCRRTGRVESGPWSDPRISTSYTFEFCPAPLGGLATNTPTRTYREWKRRQMGLVGSAVPLVRCRHHNPMLNLAFDGRIYESPGLWEKTLTNRIKLGSLSGNALFAKEGTGAAKGKKAGPPRFGQRDPQAPKELLNLTSWYNAKLTEAWLGRPNGSLASLPRGLQTFDGVDFDTRGLIQLGGKSGSAIRYPAQIQGIKVKQKCQQLHFLQASTPGSKEDQGKQIGTYVVHFANYNMQLEIPIIYGRHVAAWHATTNEPPLAPALQVAWTGKSGSTNAESGTARLFMTTWTNLVPNVEIESIDFVSSLRTAAPFVVAITAESKKPQ